MYVCGGRTRYVCISGEDYYVCKRGGGGLIMYARGGMIHYVCKKGEDSLCMHEGGEDSLCMQEGAALIMYTRFRYRVVYVTQYIQGESGQFIRYK